MKKSSLWLSAAAALVIAAILAGCGKTTYFAGRPLPPSRLINRVMIAVQNPSAFTKGALQIVDAYYDIRSSYNGKTPGFSITGFSGALPVTIQNMPEEQLGAVYGSGDGSLTYVNYAKETTAGTQSGLNGASSSVFTTRNQAYVFAASQASHVLTVVDKADGRDLCAEPSRRLPRERQPRRHGGHGLRAELQLHLLPAQAHRPETITYSGGPTTWPKAAIDCEPLNGPGWCLFQAQSPDSVGPVWHPLRRAPGLRSSHQGRLLRRRRHRLRAQLRTGMRRNHCFHFPASRSAP